MASSLELFCGKSLNNQTIWGHNSYGYCYEQLVFLLPSNVLLALVSVLYISLDYIHYRPRSPNLQRSTILYVRIVIAVTSALMPVLSLFLKLFTENTDIAPVVYLVDIVSSVAWILFSLYLWKLRRLSIELMRTHKPMILVWTFTMIAQSVRLSTVIKQLLKDDTTLCAAEESMVIASTVLQVLYLFSLIPTSRHTTKSLNVSTYWNINESTERIDGPLLTSSDELLNSNSLGVAEGNANLLSKATLWWMNPLLRKAAKGQLQHAKDVFSLPEELTANFVETYFSSIYLKESASTEEFTDDNPNFRKNGYGSLQDTFTSQKQANVSPGTDFHRQRNRLTLFRALFKAFISKFLLIGLLQVFLVALGFAHPLLLHSILKFMDDDNEPVINGYLYAVGMFSSSLVEAFLLVQYAYELGKLKTQARAALVTMVYRKSLAISGERLSRFTPGQIINFMSVDALRITKVVLGLHLLWSIPAIYIINFGIFYQQVGVASLGALSVIILLTPVTKYLIGKIMKFNKSMMKHRDSRIKLMNEILNGIRSVKFYAWESYFKQKIDHLRSQELRCLRSIKYLDGFNIYVWNTTSVLIPLSIFTTYILMGNELTAAMVFTTLALWTNTSTLKDFSGSINDLSDAWVSMRRLQEFMNLEELDPTSYYLSNNEPSGGKALSIRRGIFHWKNAQKKTDDEQTSKIKQAGKTVEEDRGSRHTTGNEEDNEKEYQGYPKLQDIDLDVFKGQLVGIFGKNGSGKSSLFSAITADMMKEKGSVFVAGLGQGFGVTTQEPWLQSGTLKENILFGRVYDAERYKRVVSACALSEDFKIMPAGDDTEIGENGDTLSGGQRARVALARAVYQESEIYLLDDPLAAVDADIGEHIFTNCIMGLLRDKTMLLCTHHIGFLQQADIVVVMDDFKIVNKGPPSVVLKYSKDASHLNNTKSLGEARNGGICAEKPTSSLRDNGDDGTDIILTEEEKAEGSVKFGHYKSYWKSVGCVLASCILAMCVLTQVSTNVMDWWLSYWVNQTKDHTNKTVPIQPLNLSSELEQRGYWSPNTENTTSSFLPFYFGIYQGLVGINSLLPLVTTFLIAYGGVHAAMVIHEKLLTSIFKAPISFFDKTPCGRILNRFSTDTYFVDYSLPTQISLLIAAVLGFLAKACLTCYTLPWYILALIPLCVLYYFIQDYYRKTYRELSRLAAISESDIYNHFSETLAGLQVIKGMRATKRFCQENRSRLDLNLRVGFIQHVLGCWLTFRLRIIGLVLLTAVALLSVVKHHFHGIDTGLVGLLILYSLTFTQYLGGIVKGLATTENDMVNLERIHHYTTGISHEQKDECLVKLSHLWPCSGVIKFSDVHFCYRKNLPKALDGVSFETRPGEKIGIIGKTGAGKSTVLKVLFRIVQIQQGTVTIDGIDLAYVSLNDIRSRLAIIPQHPFLFSSSVRNNLDPVGQFSDSELWCVLQKSQLKDVVSRMGGLEASVGDGGRQFSTGQKQLLCLARAMLTRTKVLCIDETTAGIDMETDAVLQQVIMEEFKDNTILTVAHRLDTVQDCDRILVMEAGKVVTFE